MLDLQVLSTIKSGLDHNGSMSSAVFEDIMKNGNIKADVLRELSNVGGQDNELLTD